MLFGLKKTGGGGGGGTQISPRSSGCPTTTDLACCRLVDRSVRIVLKTKYIKNGRDRKTVGYRLRVVVLTGVRLLDPDELAPLFTIAIIFRNRFAAPAIEWRQNTSSLCPVGYKVANSTPPPVNFNIRII